MASRHWGPVEAKSNTGCCLGRRHCCHSKHCKAITPQRENYRSRCRRHSSSIDKETESRKEKGNKQNLLFKATVKCKPAKKGIECQEFRTIKNFKECRSSSKQTNGQTETKTEELKTTDDHEFPGYLPIAQGQRKKQINEFFPSRNELFILFDANE